jgi:hypothetical protein
MKKEKAKKIIEVEKKKTDNSDVVCFRLPYYIRAYCMHQKEYYGIDRSNIIRIAMSEYIKRNPL